MSVTNMADMVQESSTAAGTGTLQLDGAVSGFRTFADAGLAAGFPYNKLTYAIIHQSADEWEVGYGHVDASNILTRTDVHANNLGTTAKVNFSAGTKHVYVTRTAIHDTGKPIAWYDGQYDQPRLSENGILAIGPWSNADGNYGSIAIGPMAYSRAPGHMALSCFDYEYQQVDAAGPGGSGKDGRTQAVMRNLLKETTDATPTEIHAEDVFGFRQYQMASEVACIAKAYVVGQTATAVWANELTAVFRNDPSVTLVGQSAGTAISDAGLSACSAQFLASGNVEVTGIAATNISWAATVWYYEGTRNNSV